MGVVYEGVLEAHDVVLLPAALHVVPFFGFRASSLKTWSDQLSEIEGPQLHMALLTVRKYPCQNLP